MPIYQFSCSKGHGFEQYLQAFGDLNPPCKECGDATERVWALGTRHVGVSAFPFTTKHIDGVERTFSSQTELNQFCKSRGVTQRDDVAWIEKEYLGYDIKTKKQRYREGSGRGLPGSW